MTQTAEILKTLTSAAPESIEKCAELAQLVERFVDTKGVNMMNAFRGCICPRSRRRFPRPTAFMYSLSE